MHVRMIGATEPNDDIRNEFGMKTGEDIVTYCARVSNPSNQANFETGPKLLRYLVRNKHWSPLEMVNVVFEIETTRTIARQILRHRSFHFQEFCVSGDTQITTLTKGGNSKKVKISDLYKRQNNKQYSNMSDWLVRSYDEASQTFITTKVKEVFDTGIKSVWKVVLDNGKTITTTKEHKLLTFDGFKRVENITTNDFIGCNGVPVYQNKEWLSEAKRKCVENKTGIIGIAMMANIGYHTIRKWLKKHDLQFTKQEMVFITPIWNKGLEKTLQPRFNKPHNEQTRNLMRVKSKQGKDSVFYKNGETSWRKQVAIFSKGYHLSLLHEQNFKCAISGKNIDVKTSEIDHIIPVFLRPDLAFDSKNLQILSIEEHQKKTTKERLESNKTASYSKVNRIEYVGEMQTYDMEIDHVSHNYIANGIVTHNSGRYAEFDTDQLVFGEPRLQDSKNRQNSISVDDDDLKSQWDMIQKSTAESAVSAYKWAINNGIAKELARNVLPEGLTPSRLYMNGTLRDWFHYSQLRMGNGTQLEHQEIAKAIWNELVKKYPILNDFSETT